MEGLRIRFLVIKTNAVADKYFDSYYKARKFYLKAQHSDKIKLIIYPNF